MKIEIEFKELTELISRKTVQQISLTRIDDKTVRVSKQIRIPLLNVMKNVGINLTVVGFEGSDLIVKGVSQLLSSLLNIVDGLDITPIATVRGEKVVLHLANIQSLSKALAYIEPKGLTFTSDRAIFEVSLKNNLSLHSTFNG